MKALVVAIVAACVGAPCAVAGFDPFDGPRPLVVYVRPDHWAMVIGSDNPLVAIYENGDVIFPKGVGGRLRYHHASLDASALEDVRRRVQAIGRVTALKRTYEIGRRAEDKPHAVFYLRDRDREMAVLVDGLDYPRWRPGPPDTAPPGPNHPPRELLQLHEWLSSFDAHASAEWTPKYVEVMLWNFALAPGPPVPWPSTWPTLASERAVRRGEASWSIFLDAALLPELRRFVASARGRNAVVGLDGMKLAIDYRFTFPSEPVWRAAFRRAAEEEHRQPSPRATDPPSTPPARD